MNTRRICFPLSAPPREIRTADEYSGWNQHRWGRGTLQPGRIAKPAEWIMRRELLSPACNTRCLSYWPQGQLDR
ncbi:DUF4113 domain-containing protein [Pseudomonas paraeruginosa]